MTREKSRWPTNKWWANLFTALGVWGTAFVNGGTRWTETIIILLIGIGVQAAVTYFVPNEGTPGGVPVTVRKRGKK